jgi:hypothetical protein
MSSVVISGNTSGTITLDAPAIAGTTTLTLPATSGTVVTKDTNGIISVNGVQFPATQSASSDANCLDDYEEGTWTPVIAGSSTAGTATYSSAVGRYTKIGNRVFIQCYVEWSSGTGTGSLWITGLPFTAANISGGFTSLAYYTADVALAANSFPMPFIRPNNAYVEINQSAVGGSSASSVSYDVVGTFMISGSYIV